MAISKFVFLLCEICGTDPQEGSDLASRPSTVSEARQLGRISGWKRYRGMDFCPTCFVFAQDPRYWPMPGRYEDRRGERWESNGLVAFYIPSDGRDPGKTSLEDASVNGPMTAVLCPEECILHEAVQVLR